FNHFSFNDSLTTDIYTLSLHDALPIYRARIMQAIVTGFGDERQWRVSAHTLCCRGGRAHPRNHRRLRPRAIDRARGWGPAPPWPDRKSTRLNSSHVAISYAVFCLKKKK